MTRAAIVAALALAACSNDPQQCASDSDCPHTACSTGTCESGACSETPVPRGTAVETQTAGDCRVTACDGSGDVFDDVDNSDVPATTNPCVQATCADGEPSLPPQDAGMACGTGLVCDGAGACVGCLDATTCPGPDTECQTRTCVQGTCGFSYAAQGTAVAAQTAGDCQHVQCNGSGATESVADDNDLPDDSNACTHDSCSGGTPAYDDLASGVSCGSGATCDGSGQCLTAWIAANTGFTGTVCIDGLHFGSPLQSTWLAACTEDHGIWRATMVDSSLPARPLVDPSWTDANGTTAGQMVTSLTGRGLGIYNQNGKIAFFTTNTTDLNYFGTGSFGMTPVTWQTGAMNQVGFTPAIFGVKLGSGNNNYLAGWDPVSGQAVVLHGNTIATVCATNGQGGCSYPALIGAGVTGTATSVVSGNDNISATTLDIHVSVTGTTPSGGAANGGGVYWSCDNGASYVEDDAGIAIADKPLVWKLVADDSSYGAHAARTCPTNSTNLVTYTSTMYAALLGGASIYKTVDGGARWTASNTGLPAGVAVYSLAIDCAATGVAGGPSCGNPQLLYAGTAAGVYRSTDGGAHWALDGLGGSAVRAVGVEAHHATWSIAASPGGVTETGTTATFSVDAHDFEAGDQVTIIGVADPGYNGTYSITSAPSPTTFTVELATSGLSPSGGGTAFATQPRVVAATDQPNAIFQGNVPH